jgi:hypothetical protein
MRQLNRQNGFAPETVLWKEKKTSSATSAMMRSFQRSLKDAIRRQPCDIVRFFLVIVFPLPENFETD